MDERSILISQVVQTLVDYDLLCTTNFYDEETCYAECKRLIAECLEDYKLLKGEIL